MRTINPATWIAWLLFLISLVCPAAQIDAGAWDKPDAHFVPGWMCAIFGWPHYVSNGLLFLSPLCFNFARRMRSPMGLRLFAGAFLLSGLACLAWLPATRAIHVGYVLWTMSYFLACFAFLHASLPESESGGVSGR